YPGNVTRAIDINGQPAADPAQLPVTDYRTVSADFFDTLRIPILQCRGLTLADREDSQPVAIVSRSLANRHWPGTDPVGKRLRAGTGPWLTVVGVCGE